MKTITIFTVRAHQISSHNTSCACVAGFGGMIDTKNARPFRTTMRFTQSLSRMSAHTHTTDTFPFSYLLIYAPNRNNVPKYGG
jgi:hypothetical protein